MLRALLLMSILAVPALARAQAEPAPPGYIPPGKSEAVAPPPSPYKWHMEADARLPVPLGPTPPGLLPVGWGAGVQVTRALVDVARMRFGVGGDFAYQRLAESSDHFLSHMSFAALGVIDGIFGRVRPWVAAGVGLSVANYQKPAVDTMHPRIDVDTVVPMVEVGLGLDIELVHNVEIGFGGELDLTFSSLTVGDPPLRAFQPGLFAARLGVGFRF